MNRKRVVAGLLSLLFLIAALLVGARVLILNVARGVLGHWSEAGLPGNPPRGEGPFVDMRWPPHVRWSNLRWGEGDSLRLSCSELRIVIAPIELLRGRVRLSKVDVESLEVSTTKSISPWSDLVIESLDATAPERLDRGRDAVRFQIAPVTFDSSSVRLSRLEGWAWAPRHAGWAFITKAARDGPPGSMIVRGSGSGVAGSGEFTVDADMGENRLLHVSARHPSAGRWVWQVSGRDDGTIISTLLMRRMHLAVPAHGLVDFSISRAPQGALEGEAQVEDLKLGPLSATGKEALTANGRLCLGDGVMSLQGVDLRGADTSLQIDVDVPLIPSDPSSGRCLIAGEWYASNVRLDGSVRRIGEDIVLHAPVIDLGNVRMGPADLRWFAPGPGALSHLEGNVKIGSGAVSMRGQIGSGDPLILHGRAIPISLIAHWLPFAAAGEWSGQLEAQAAIRFTADGWNGEGRASLIDSQVRGAPLLEQIGSLWGERAGIGVRFGRVSTRWSYSLGRFVADSLTAQSRSLLIRGSIVYALPDSVLGILRLSPGSESQAGSILRLLGGDSGGLDVGISGSAGSPGIVLLDPPSSAEWRERIKMLRRATSKS